MKQRTDFYDWFSDLYSSKPKDENKHIELINGSRIELVGTDEKLKGITCPATWRIFDM